MYGSGRRGSRQEMNVWPGWVDALSSLIMVIIFVLMIFVVAQFYLAHTLTGRDQALAKLNQKIGELSELLAVERRGSADLRLNTAQLSDQLQASLTAREQLSADLTAIRDERDQLSNRFAALSQRVDTTTGDAARVSRNLEDAYKTIDADRDKIEMQLREIASLEADLKALREARDKLEGDVAALTVLARQLQQQTVEQDARISAGTTEQAKQAEMLRLTEDQRRSLETLLAQVREQATASETQRIKLGDELRLSEDQRKQLLAELTALRDRARALDSRIATEAERTSLAQQEIDKRDIRIKELMVAVESTQAALTGEKQLTADDDARIAALSAEMAALRAEMAKLATSLTVSEATAASREAQIGDLTGRLNTALASKVEELARYRSEFFGRLREAIGTRPDVRVVGDRFVFQSEVLFPTGSATLQDAGKGQLLQLARTLLDIARTIPPGVNWILRVDGHTDPRPIATYQFPSNWELSTGRAISVVKFLIEQGVPSERLAATGFGEYQPLEPGNGEDAFARNRRIELKLDQR